MFSLVGWPDLNSNKEIWSHKSCKGKFFKETFLSSYEEKLKEKENNFSIITSDDNAMEIDDAPSYIRESRSKLDCSDTRSSCIICNEKKYEKGRAVPLVLIILRVNTTKSYKAEEKLKEFADIHLRNGKTPYLDGAKRIRLQLSVKSLFAADVSYHRECYLNFRTPKWKRSEIVSETSGGSTAEDHFQDFCEIVQFHIIERKEVYTTSQLVNWHITSASRRNHLIHAKHLDNIIQNNRA